MIIDRFSTVILICKPVHVKIWHVKSLLYDTLRFFYNDSHCHDHFSKSDLSTRKWIKVDSLEFVVFLLENTKDRILKKILVCCLNFKSTFYCLFMSTFKNMDSCKGTWLWLTFGSLQIAVANLKLVKLGYQTRIQFTFITTYYM